MITAAYMAYQSDFRREFIQPGYTLDPAIQPIDAPNTIPAGSCQRVPAISYYGEYPLPSAISREY